MEFTRLEKKLHKCSHLSVAQYLKCACIGLQKDSAGFQKMTVAQCYLSMLTIMSRVSYWKGNCLHDLWLFKFVT